MAQRDARPPFAAIDGAVPSEFSALPTPCYLLDEAALTRNAEILGGLARRTGCKVLLAQKAFSNYDLYPLLAPHLAGTEASGLFEARLGAEEMPGKEVHVFCAAYRADEMDELLRYADHIVFNSPAQLAKFGPAAKAAGKSAGLRVNPECSTQDGHAIYDPCAPGSRLGTTRAQWDAVAAEPSAARLLDGLHFHTLCEQDADALAVTLDAVAEKFGDLLPKIKWLNFGGGHHVTRRLRHGHFGKLHPPRPARLGRDGLSRTRRSLRPERGVSLDPRAGRRAKRRYDGCHLGCQRRLPYTGRDRDALPPAAAGGRRTRRKALHCAVGRANLPCRGCHR